VWARAPGDVWAIVSTAGPERYYLLHTRPPAKGPIPTPEAIDLKRREYSLPGPPLDSCETPFVLLYTVSRTAPADYDYPTTRAALKAHPELKDAEFIEFERDGRRYFGAKVPDFTFGQKLADLVKRQVPGSTPQLACHNPIEKRKLTIDFESGKPLK